MRQHAYQKVGCGAEQSSLDGVEADLQDNDGVEKGQQKAYRNANRTKNVISNVILINSAPKCVMMQEGDRFIVELTFRTSRQA